MKTKKLKRYHKDIFFPKNSEEMLDTYLEDMGECGSITFSLHSVEKIVDYCVLYGKNLLKYLLKSVRRDSINIDNVFEFYSSNGMVKKACFRYSFEEFPVDIILVISADAVVITVYVANKKDTHTSMNKALYEKN